MSDFHDRASAREEELRSDAIDEARYLVEAQRRQPAAEFCRLCEEPIPLARRRAVPGVQTCVDCQQELEYATVSGGD